MLALTGRPCLMGENVGDLLVAPAFGAAFTNELVEGLQLGLERVFAWAGRWSSGRRCEVLSRGSPKWFGKFGTVAFAGPTGMSCDEAGWRSRLIPTGAIVQTVV